MGIITVLCLLPKAVVRIKYDKYEVLRKVAAHNKGTMCYFLSALLSFILRPAPNLMVVT